MGRPLRGSRLVSFYTLDTETDPIAPPSLSTLDSAFQLQEYIGALVRLNPHDIERIIKVPGSSSSGTDEKEKEALGEDERVSVDEACWIYEQLRRLAQDLTHPLITTLQQECTRQTCPEMKAGEWLYLCVAHGNSGAMEHCCAIDYIVHTLDSATALLNSPRAFPSRISIPQTSHRHFPSLARRLGRIFAHAYHHHRLAFESAEAESALYARFLALSRHFDLVPTEFLVIPERNTQDEEEGDVGRKDVTLLTRHHENSTNDSATLPASTTSLSSQSPRIGGRARTDTMYLSGGYSSPHGRRSPGSSPRPSPRPTATTLAADISQAQETSIATGDVTEASATQEGTDEVLSQDKTGQVEVLVPEVNDSAVPVRIPGQIYARDFALEASLPASLREPAAGGADSIPAAELATATEEIDIDGEQDTTSSYFEAPTDTLPITPSETSSESDITSSIPSDPVAAAAEPPVSEITSDTAEAMETLAGRSQFVTNEGAVAPEPDIQAESLQNNVGAGAGANDRGTEENVVMGEDVVAETEMTTDTDAQQEGQVASMENNTEKSPQTESEDGVSQAPLGDT